MIVVQVTFLLLVLVLLQVVLLVGKGHGGTGWRFCPFVVSTCSRLLDMCRQEPFLTLALDDGAPQLGIVSGPILVPPPQTLLARGILSPKHASTTRSILFQCDFHGRSSISRYLLLYWWSRRLLWCGCSLCRASDGWDDIAVATSCSTEARTHCSDDL
jgi:hypothetical protein